MGVNHQGPIQVGLHVWTNLPCEVDLVNEERIKRCIEGCAARYRRNKKRSYNMKL